jgi:hypothetical protein
MLRVPFTSSSNNDFRSAVVKWLARCDLKIAARVWRMFWVDDKSSKIGERWYYTVHLFAVSGTDLEPIPLKMFLNWHSPFFGNMQSTNLKYFARFKLGLSKTTPTIVLEKDEFILADDIRELNGKVMNDGCALMSLELAAAITNCMGLDELPAVFQGRISGCKGLWMVDRLGSHRHNLYGRDFWIQITPSQLKIQPHPSQRDTADESLRTFEVSNFSATLQPSALSFQFINVLYNRGVRREILEQRLKATFNEYYDELREGIGTFDILKCRAWLQRYHTQRTPDGGGLVFVGSKPQLRSDAIKYMLDAGFAPKDCKQLDDLIRETLKAYTDDLIARVRITLPRSTFAYMMADPYSILEEGEVQLCLPQTWKDPELGLQGSVVANLMGLVGRNPANLPCDIQKVRFVHHVELSCYRNVIIFSTRGKRPLADWLSGGDYDGDQAFVCWDQGLVKDFENYDAVPTDVISPSNVGLKQVSRPLAAVLDVKSGISLESIGDLLEGCLDFASRQSLLGTVTNKHVEFVYYQTDSKQAFSNRKALEAPQALQLAALASYLVDASKQGYLLSDPDWYKLRNKLCGNIEKSRPAFQRPPVTPGVPQRGGDSGDPLPDNINDHLRFVVATGEATRILTDWYESFTRSTFPDASLAKPYQTFEASARAEETGKRRTLRKIIDRLKEDIEGINNQWKTDMSAKRWDNGPASVEQSRVIRALYQKVCEVEPLKVAGDRNHWFYKAREQAKESGLDTWPMLRASCIYVNHYRRGGNFVWAMAMEQLCRLKAAGGPGRYVTQTALTYSATKLDMRVVRRLQGAVSANERSGFPGGGVVAAGGEGTATEEEETRYWDAVTDFSGPIEDYFIR